jgi:hypothetical protein
VITSICDTPSAVAVSVAFCEALTADAVTLKAAEVPPLGTATEAGARSELLLLDSFTTAWLVAAPLRDTKQVSLCAPVIECVPHERPFNFATGSVVVPAGDKVITSVFLTPRAIAVSVAFCAVLTADAVTLNAAVVLPAATITEDGVRSALLLLESSTCVWLVAGVLK